MTKVLVYVLDHDYGNGETGVNILGEKCVLRNCNETIENGAKKGDLIFAIGGRRLGSTKGNAGKYHQKFIYAMKVQEISPPSSNDFCFLGDKAIDAPELPVELHNLIFGNNWGGRKAKYIDESHFFKFEKFLEKYGKGKIGEHCDMENKTSSATC